MRLVLDKYDKFRIKNMLHIFEKFILRNEKFTFLSRAFTRISDFLTFTQVQFSPVTLPSPRSPSTLCFLHRLSTCISIYLCRYLCLSLSLSLSLSVSLSLSLCLYLSIFISLSLCLSRSVLCVMVHFLMNFLIKFQNNSRDSLLSFFNMSVSTTLCGEEKLGPTTPIFIHILF